MSVKQIPSAGTVLTGVGKAHKAPSHVLALVNVELLRVDGFT